jgi:hypothetical protein
MINSTNIHRHIQAIAWINIIIGTLFLICAILVFFLSYLISTDKNNNLGARGSGHNFTIGGLICSALGLFPNLTGKYILKNCLWAHNASIILSAIYAVLGIYILISAIHTMPGISIMSGYLIILGVYSLIVLMHPDSKKAFKA